MIVRILADLALAAVRWRQDRHVVTWLGACALDPRGSGRVEIVTLAQLVPPRWIGEALFGRPTYFRGASADALYYSSTAHVASCFGLERVRTAGFLVPLEALTTGSARRRAHLALGALSVLQAKKPISVTMIAAEAGVSRRTAFFWLKLTRWRRRRRIALQPVRVTPGTFRWISTAQPGPFLIVRRRGRLRLARRLPNALGQTWPGENRKWLARRINAALPAPLATRVLHGVPAASHPAQSQAYARDGNLASSPAADPAPPNCQREGEDFERGSGETFRR